MPTSTIRPRANLAVLDARTAVFLSTLVFFNLLTLTRAFSWFDKGHRIVGLIAQAVWTSVLCLSGTYSQLLDYIVFAAVLFYMLTVVGLFLLRARRPDLPRPIRAPGYPVLPGLYLAATALICLNLLIKKPLYTWPGVVIVALGVPMYFGWRRAVRRTIDR